MHGRQDETDMTSTTDRLAEYVPADEPLAGVYAAEMTVPTDVYRDPVVVGVTDERLVSLSETDEFTSVALDRVTSMRSTRTADVSYRGMDHRLLLAGSLLLGTVALVVAGALLADLLAASLFLLAVGGVLMLSFGHQGRPAELTERLGALDYWEVGAVDDRHRLLAGGSALTVLGLSGLVAVTPTLAAAALGVAVLLLVGSVWLADYAWRHRGEFDGIERVRRRRTEVRVRTEAGTTLSFLTDATEDLDRALSRGSYRATASKATEATNGSDDVLIREH